MQEYHLRSPIGGAPIYHLPETESTMLEARRLVTDGAPSGVVVLTDYQSAGRGRLPGREWVSPPRESLMFTVALEISTPHAMPLRVGLAIARTLERQCALTPRIKWPNDLLVNNRKICGVLCEYTAPWLYVGVGLNLMQREFPADIAGRATSVLLESHAADPAPILEGILQQIEGGLAEWRPGVEKRLWHNGMRTTVTMPDGSKIVGTIAGLGEDGSLLVTRAGTTIHIAAGELLLAGPDEDPC